jgi:MFS family permease
MKEAISMPVQCTKKMLHSAKQPFVQPHTNSPQKIISNTVWLLSFVSLFNDIASEMLTPVMPMFLKQIGFTVIFIGILEGIAEAVAGLSKSYFGMESDRSRKRLPFVQWGYALSAVSKPLMSVFVYPLWIFFARTMDKFGKGIRTGARDAMLSDEATPSTKGRVFGVNRAMDSIGAVIGPGLALLYLNYYPNDYKTLFLLTFAPGIVVILLTRLVKEKKQGPVSAEKRQRKFFPVLSYWKNSPPAYKKLMVGLLMFALFNSADVFLLLKMKDTGMSDTKVIGIYMFYNLFYALASYPLGALADKIGLKKIFIVGLFLFAIVYGGFAFNQDLIIFFVLFALYGIYQAATDGVSKAWISNIVDRNHTATAIGTYTGLQSICALLASSICGFLWFQFGATVTFVVTAIATVLVTIYLLAAVPYHEQVP